MFSEQDSASVMAEMIRLHKNKAGLLSTTHSALDDCHDQNIFNNQFHKDKYGRDYHVVLRCTVWYFSQVGLKK